MTQHDMKQKQILYAKIYEAKINIKCKKYKT